MSFTESLEISDLNSEFSRCVGLYIQIPQSDKESMRYACSILLLLCCTRNAAAVARFGGSGTNDTGVRRDLCYLGARYIAGMPTLVLPSAPDPLLSGKFLLRYKLPRGEWAVMSPEEKALHQTDRAMRSLVELRPRTAADLGITYEENGTVLRRPPPEGLNHRVGLLRAQGRLEDNGLTAYEDHSLAGVDHVEFARRFIKNQFPMAVAGMEGDEISQLYLHYHDFDAHALGYYLMPKLVVERSQARLSFLVNLLDSPRVNENENAKKAVEAAIRREVQGLDGTSGSIQARFMEDNRIGRLAATDGNNPKGAIMYLATLRPTFSLSSLAAIPPDLRAFIVGQVTNFNGAHPAPTNAELTAVLSSLQGRFNSLR